MIERDDAYMFSKGYRRSFLIHPANISLDNATPQIYNWTLKLFQQSYRTVNFTLEKSYDDEHLVSG